MKREKVLNETSQKRVLLDKTSEYYRECPQCFKEFMAHHMSQKFCSDKCGDDFNNAKKRLANPVVESLPVQNKPESKETTPQPSIAPLEKNLRILNSLYLDPINGSYFHLEDLVAKGYDFGAYAGKAKLYNIPTDYNCHFLQVGEYRLYLTEYSTCLIVKTKNT